MKSELEALLKHPLRVQVKDGRVFIGCFYGTDKLLNVLLVDANEYRSEQRQPRSVGHDSMEDCRQGRGRGRRVYIGKFSQ